MTHKSIRWRIHDILMPVMLWPRDLVGRICPLRVRHFYGLAVAGIQIIILYGWGTFWRRFQHYRKAEKNISLWKTRLKQGIRQQEVFEINPEQFLLPDKARVAVVVHAYYPDVFSEICAHLKGIPPFKSEFLRIQPLEFYCVRYLLPGKTNLLTIVNCAWTRNSKLCHSVISNTCK